MTRRHVILELHYTKPLARFAEAAATAVESELDSAVVPKLETLEYDEKFTAVALPGYRSRGQSDDPYDTSALFEIDETPDAGTYMVRGEIDEQALPELEKEVKKNKAVAGIFADVEIEPQIVCPGDPAVGTDADVERLLCVDRMHRNRMDGRGILVAVVDTGVNMAYLNSHGKNPTFDAVRSWSWGPGLTPGSMPVSHGTMVAFDVCIAAPRCTLLDITLLHSVPSFGALLSDAVRAYRHLLDVMRAPTRPGENRSLVVNNSWGMFHPSWDFPVGHPGNYSDNPNHTFNRIVATLERAGADILFAAGNCGADCPDGRCAGVVTNAIYGANGHPSVLCVAGVDTTKDRVGYSTIGPGRLERRKPDICGYTHFSGSGVYPADGGTSAATPVVSGTVAAVRTKRPYDPSNAVTHPAAIRNLLTSTAEDRGAAGYDFRYGYGIVNGCELVDKLAPEARPPHPICRWLPWICDPRWWRLIGIEPPFGRLAEEASRASAIESIGSVGLDDDAGEEPSIEKLAYLLGVLAGKSGAAGPSEDSTCSCKGSEQA